MCFFTYRNIQYKYIYIYMDTVYSIYVHKSKLYKRPHPNEIDRILKNTRLDSIDGVWACLCGVTECPKVKATRF